MFSVFRIELHGGHETRSSLITMLEQMFPGKVDEDLRAPGRFSFTIGESSDWREHEAKLAEFLVRHNEGLRRAAAAGARFEIDCAIGSDDYSARWLTEIRIDSSLLELLQSLAVEIVFSIYGDGSH